MPDPEVAPAWLVDSSIYVFKAWFTRADEKTDIHGNPINAVRGFMDFVYRLLSSENPRLIAFAFDESLQSSHRRDIYPAYKANRAPAPESLKIQFKYCRQFIRALGIHEAASSRYEADDLIGTWASSLRQEDIPVYIISADKDLAQLVHKKDYWWEYERGEKMDSKRIEKRFKAKPHQIADQLAIAGDKSDNIPGVPGIGMATAGKLLCRFDNLEGLLASIEQISEMQIRGASRIQSLINEHNDTIRLSRQLTGIVCDIEPINNAIFARSKPDEALFNQLCEELTLSEKERHKWGELTP